MTDHAACQAAHQALYDAAVEAMENTGPLTTPREAFEYRLSTAGHLYHREGIADLIRERDDAIADAEALRERLAIAEGICRTNGWPDFSGAQS